MQHFKFYSDRAEKANYISHAFGVVMAVVGTIVLLTKASVTNNNWAILAHSIFGFGMFVCMLSSTVYHYVKHPKTKTLLRHFDHASIYVLIAASYSPFSLILAAGGAFYIIGSVIYALAKKEFAHTVFHIFVLLGLGCHIISAYLIPL